MRRGSDGIDRLKGEVGGERAPAIAGPIAGLEAAGRDNRGRPVHGSRVRALPDPSGTGSGRYRRGGGRGLRRRARLARAEGFRAASRRVPAPCSTSRRRRPAGARWRRRTTTRPRRTPARTRLSESLRGATRPTRRRAARTLVRGLTPSTRKLALSEPRRLRGVHGEPRLRRRRGRQARGDREHGDAGESERAARQDVSTPPCAASWHRSGGLPLATRLTPLGVPWLCGPASRRGCPCREVPVGRCQSKSRRGPPRSRVRAPALDPCPARARPRRAPRHASQPNSSTTRVRPASPHSAGELGIPEDLVQRAAERGRVAARHDPAGHPVRDGPRQLARVTRHHGTRHGHREVHHPALRAGEIRRGHDARPAEQLVQLADLDVPVDQLDPLAVARRPPADGVRIRVRRGHARDREPRVRGRRRASSSKASIRTWIPFARRHSPKNRMVSPARRRRRLAGHQPRVAVRDHPDVPASPPRRGTRRGSPRRERRPRPPARRSARSSASSSGDREYRSPLAAAAARARLVADRGHRRPAWQQRQRERSGGGGRHAQVVHQHHGVVAAARGHEQRAKRARPPRRAAMPARRSR